MDITATLARKIKPLACHGSEMRPAPRARSMEAVRALAVSRGMTIGYDAAEAFDLVRSIVPSE